MICNFAHSKAKLHRAFSLSSRLATAMLPSFSIRERIIRLLQHKLIYVLQSDESEFTHCKTRCRLNWSHGATILNHCGLFFCHFLASAAVLGGLLLLLFFSVTGFAATTVYLWCMMLCFDELLCIIHESAIASVRLVFSPCYADAIAYWESILCEAVVNVNGTVSQTNCVKDGS
ncbi:hypothetical protein QL285_003985 [Trifolium repens]|nr:hypothetical protein QL285_003985 [Trifolium repens]